MKTFKELAKDICEMDQSKEQLTIAQASQALKSLAKVLAIDYLNAAPALKLLAKKERSKMTITIEK